MRRIVVRAEIRRRGDHHVGRSIRHVRELARVPFAHRRSGGPGRHRFRKIRHPPHQLVDPRREQPRGRAARNLPLHQSLVGIRSLIRHLHHDRRQHEEQRLAHPHRVALRRARPAEAIPSEGIDGLAQRHQLAEHVRRIAARIVETGRRRRGPALCIGPPRLLDDLPHLRRNRRGRLRQHGAIALRNRGRLEPREHHPERVRIHPRARAPCQRRLDQRGPAAAKRIEHPQCIRLRREQPPRQQVMKSRRPRVESVRERWRLPIRDHVERARQPRGNGGIARALDRSPAQPRQRPPLPLRSRLLRPPRRPRLFFLPGQLCCWSGLYIHLRLRCGIRPPRGNLQRSRNGL